MRPRKVTHPQILLLRTVRKPFPRPTRVVPDKKKAAARRRVKHVTDPNL